MISWIVVGYIQVVKNPWGHNNGYRAPVEAATEQYA